jgi:hypothetical protein
MRVFGVAIAALMLAGCQTDQRPTASGSPEITIAGAKSDQVKPLIVNAGMNRGMKLKNDTPYQITFEQPWGGSVASAALADAMVGASLERLTFSVAESGTGTRVVLDRYMVRARYGREEVSPANNGLGTESLQAILDSMAPSLQPARR